METADVGTSSAQAPDGGLPASGWVRRHPVVLFGTLVAAPLVAAAIVLAWRPWVPVLDMAMTELRVRDVGTRHTPLIGLPGRIGDFPDQGSHPGPWSFYLVAPFYRLAGSTAWGLQFGSVVVNTAVVFAVVALGRRRFGWRGAVAAATLAAIAVRGYGLVVLTHPWNPYFPVLVWLLVLLAAWLVLMGDDAMAVVVVAGASLAAQTHVPYLVSAVAICALVIGVLTARVVASRRGARPGRPDALRPLLAALAVGAVMWVPPLVEQLVRSPGNVTRLVRHFLTEPDEEAIGIGPAVRVVLHHLDAFSIGWDLVAREDALVHRAGSVDGVAVGGGVVLVLWLAAVLWALHDRHGPLLALHTVIAVALVAGTLSVARIFGKVWFYLTLWMSATTLLIVLALGWTVWRLVAQLTRRPARDLTAGLTCAVAATVVVTAGSLIAVGDHRMPVAEHGADVLALLPTITVALDRGEGPAPGPEGRYVVFWQESVVPGAQGYALLNELERRGYDVGVHPTWRVPATSHRVRHPGEFDAEIHFVSGAWIEGWREHPERIEIAHYDRRTPAQRARFTELESRVRERLIEIGRPDLVETMELNIFGASLAPGLPADIVADLDQMLRLGEEVSIFLAPAGSTS